jgi:hypothetical protein
MFVDYDDVSEISEKEKPKKITYREFDSCELVHLNKSFVADDYGDFDETKYPYSLNFYDFEVFMGDWLVVIINPVEKIKRIIANDSVALKNYYEQHKDQIWVGYNSRNYDTYILKAILLGLNPKKVNDMIIMHGMKGWQISDDFRNIQFYNFDIATRIVGLKQLEGFMGNDIRETTVPFDLNRPLTKKEMTETVKYCMHDVEQTIEVFKLRDDDFNAHMDLISTFELPLKMISLTQAQLTANIIGCRKIEWKDEFDIQFVDTLRLKKYKFVQDWFENSENMDYKKSFETEVCGIPHIFGWGGLHGCVPEPIHVKGRIYHVDVTSYYPSIMIRYDFLTRNCKDKKKFKEIYDKRVALKKAGKKKEQAPYKIILNGTYGICKDKFSSAYDPRQANNVCINGQLMLLDLLEHLEGSAEIIQSNTDGIILQVADNEESVQKMKDICQEWIQRTGMGLGFDEITEIWQKDVNNYIFRFNCQKDVNELKFLLKDVYPKLERKGAYVKELNELDYDLPIVNEAVVKFLTENIEPEATIKSCSELKKFQKIIKVNGSYLYGWHNGEFLTDKTFRVFASKDSKDTYIGRCKTVGGTVEKFANTPENCFVRNENVNGVEVPNKLNKRWYINLAEKRIEDFGISMNKSLLF